MHSFAVVAPVEMGPLAAASMAAAEVPIARVY